MWTAAERGGDADGKSWGAGARSMGTRVERARTSIQTERAERERERERERNACSVVSAGITRRVASAR